MELTEARRQWLTTPRPWASAGHLAGSWSLYLLLAVVAVRAPLFGRVPAWIVMGWLLLGNGAIVHEAAHRHLFPSARANHIVGAIAGAAVLLPWGVYRPYHLSHHRYTVAIEDPEGPPLRFHSRLEYPLLALGGLAFLIRLNGYGIATAAGRPPPWLRTRPQRRIAVTDTALSLIVLALVVALAIRNPGVLVSGWLIPWLIALLVIVPLVLVTEHYGATVGTVEAAENTRTVVSNRLVRWVYWNNNFHMEHHELPPVVFQALPKLDGASADRLPGAWVSPGYLAFHRGVWRSLPWRAGSGKDGHPGSTV
jgi:fatty acid desaturase